MILFGHIGVYKRSVSAANVSEHSLVRCSVQHCAALDSFSVAGAGVQSLDFNRQEPHLLAVGLHDGSVRVYDLRYKVRCEHT